MIKKSVSPKVREIGIGLLGLGTVGTGVVKILNSQAKILEEKTGVRLVLKKVAVRSLSKKRLVALPKNILTTRPMELALDPSIHILIELIGGIEPAQGIILKALSQGKHVVTANKALLAEQGDFLFREADRYSRKIGFEASVCGGIPIIKSFKEGLVSNNISQILGIVNGTCNYILTKMSEEKADFAAVLKEAQAQGYAEQDPRFDIDGVDSAHKLTILARLAFEKSISFKSVSTEGIRGIALEDIEYAKELGYALKLLAVGKKSKTGLELRVHPTLLPFNHPLAGVRGVYNAVFVHADQAGDLLFYGRGAGMMPTASAVMSDVIDIARRIASEGETIALVPSKKEKARMCPLNEIHSKFYLRFEVLDKPGVLGMIAETLGQHQISILSVHQKESHSSKSVPVIILTYAAAEKNLRDALKVIDAKKAVSQKTTVIRVES